MYHDFLSIYGIDLTEVLPAVAAGISRYTPRLLLSLIETLDEGSATYASRLELPEARGWTKQSDLLVAVHNAIQVNTMIVGGIPKKDRDKFELIDSPIVKKYSKMARSQAKTKGRNVLAAAATDSLSDLPQALRGKKKKTKE